MIPNNEHRQLHTTSCAKHSVPNCKVYLPNWAVVFDKILRWNPTSWGVGGMYPPVSEIHIENLHVDSKYVFPKQPNCVCTNEHRKKRPTKKVHNQFRPPETKLWRRQSRLGITKKRMLANTWLPSKDFRFDRCVFSGRHAGHGGRTKNESAQSGPIYPNLFLCWGVFPPLIY